MRQVHVFRRQGAMFRPDGVRGECDFDYLIMSETSAEQAQHQQLHQTDDDHHQHDFFFHDQHRSSYEGDYDDSDTDDDYSYTETDTLDDYSSKYRPPYIWPLYNRNCVTSSNDIN